MSETPLWAWLTMGLLAAGIVFICEWTYRKLHPRQKP